MNKTFFLSGFFAFFIELLLVITLVYVAPADEKIQYKSKDNTALDSIVVDTIMDTKDLVVDKKEESLDMPKDVVSQETQQDLKSESLFPSSIPAPPSPLAGSGIKKLFSKVDKDLEQPKKDFEPEDNLPKIASNIQKRQDYKYDDKNEEFLEKSKEIKEKLESIGSKKIEVTHTSVVDRSDGVYDEWFSDVRKVLYSRWEGIYQEGSMVVSVTITDAGLFSFKIVKFSDNEFFNKHMQDMLLSLKSVSFPPYPKGKSINIEVVYSTKGR